MPVSRPQLTLDDVARHVRDDVFRARCRGDVGIELEWLTVDRRDPARRPRLDELDHLMTEVGALPHGGTLTLEPGGQLELSTRPQPSVADACRAAADDLFVLDRTCRAQGIDLVALGCDPLRPARRIIVAPRYRAMNEHFDRDGAHGRTMMCNTASIQLNVGLGQGSDAGRRWRLAHAVGPVLVAAFANSPLEGGRPTGWVSARMRAWWGIDPTRTAPVPVDGDPAEAWTRYALDANVMLLRGEGDECRPVPEPLPFRRWLTEGYQGSWPSADDLAYHLTTLFPPVRPRGWLELRMLDILPTPYWHVAVAVATVLLDDPAAGRAAEAATAPLADRERPIEAWLTASRTGLRHEPLGVAADACFAAAREALARRGADDATLALCADYHRRFVARGRAPADDRLDAWRRDGTLHPAAESPIPYAELEAAWR